MEHEIGAVGNFAYELNNRYVFGDLNYCHLLIDDRDDFDISQYFIKAILFIEQQRLLGRNVLLHCQMGKSRSAAILIAYLMFKRKMSCEEAYAFVKSKRSLVCPNPGFLEQLKCFNPSSVVL